ncbi:MAG: GNAT family N-acetyltransferase, partial [Variovorax sp.]
MVLSELMPAIDGLTPVQLASADVLAGVALSNAAGWNQTADDWQLFTTQGRAIGWRTARSELVASAATLPYAGGMAWISMVLVATAWQHRGLAKRLLQDCVQQLQADGLLPLLDATPAGEAVYCRMGFRRGFEFQRWATQPGAQASSADRGPVAGVDLEEARGEKAL